MGGTRREEVSGCRELIGREGLFYRSTSVFDLRLVVVPQQSGPVHAVDLVGIEARRLFMSLDPRCQSW